MGSPVVQDDFPELASTADVCTRLSQLLTLWTRFGSFLGWLLDSNGNLSDDVLEGIADRTVPVGTGSSYAPNANGGEASHTLTIAELPAHNHTNDQYTNILKPVQAGSITGSDTSNSDTEANVTTSAAMSSVGSGAAHENRPPYRAVPFMIKVK